MQGMLHSQPRPYLDAEGLLQCLQVLLQSCCLLPPKFCQVRVKVGLISNIMKAFAMPYEVHHLQVRQMNSTLYSKVQQAKGVATGVSSVTLA